MDYSGWKQLNRINIIYSIGSTVELNGKKYTKAHIAEAGNTKACQKALESGKSWARGWYSRDKEKEPVVVETDNTGFSFQIASAAGNSWSQGGKLSFWMCIMEKEGIEPFAVGINSDLLADLILESTVYKGAVKEKVFFARRNSQLGVLHENMPSYQELLKDQEIKKNINKGKTTKWKIGYEYNTLTQSDVMFGYFSPIATHKVICKERKYSYSYACEKTLVLDFDAEPKPFFDSVSKDNTWEKVFPYIEHHTNRLPAKCPSRQEGKQVFEESAIYYTYVSELLLKHFKNNKNHSDVRYGVDDKAAFIVFTHSPNVTIQLLKLFRERYKKAIYNIEHNIKDDFNKYEYDNYRSRFTVDYLIYENINDNVDKNIDYNGKRYTFHKDIISYYDKLIEIAEIEKEKRNGANSK